MGLREREVIQFLFYKFLVGVVWKIRVDKKKTIKRLLEKSTQEMMEVQARVLAWKRVATE